jgi:hypothetical protein
VQARNGVGVEHVAAHCPSLLRFQRSNDADFLSFLQWWEARREARHWAGLGGGAGLALFVQAKKTSEWEEENRTYHFRVTVAGKCFRTSRGRLGWTIWGVVGK